MDSRTKRIWGGLVSYANSTPTTIDVDRFRRTVADCMPWYVAAGPLGLFAFLLVEEELKQAREYLPRIQGLLRWLIAKPEEKEGLGQEACDFLYEHMQHIKWRLMEVERPEHIKEELKGFNYGRAELERFHEEAEKYWADATRWTAPAPRSPQVLKRGDSLLGIRTPAKDYEDLADPLCDFFLTEYQRHHEREQSRKDKKAQPLVPIFACPSCNKFVMPERIGRKKYCSDCSDKARNEENRKRAPLDEGRDYQWLYRLSKEERDLRKARLRLPKFKNRLTEIMARQKNSARCQNLIQDMRLHVAPTKEQSD